MILLPRYPKLNCGAPVDAAVHAWETRPWAQHETTDKGARLALFERLLTGRHALARYRRPASRKSQGGFISFFDFGPGGGDTYFSSVVLLAHMDDTGLTDVKGHTATLVGNGARSATQSVYGGFSYVGDGTSDCVAYTINSDFQPGAGEFTAECYFWANALAVKDLLGTYATTNATSGFAIIQQNTSGALTGSIYRGSSGDLLCTSANGTFAANAWYRMAYVRDNVTGGVNRGYLYCGAAAGTIPSVANSSTTASGNAMNSVTTPVYVGAENNGSFSWNGYIDEIRITKNVCRYPGGTTLAARTTPWEDF